MIVATAPDLIPPAHWSKKPVGYFLFDEKQYLAHNRTMSKKSKPINKLKFSVPHFISSDKSAFWFLGVFVLFAAIIVFALWQKDYRLGAIFLLGAACFYQMALSNPNKVELEFNPEGIIFDKKRFDWDQFRSFSIWNEKSHFVVHLERKSSLAGPLVLVVPGAQNRDLVPVALGSVLAEKYHPHITISDLFARLLRY